MENGIWSRCITYVMALNNWHTTFCCFCYYLVTTANSCANVRLYTVAPNKQPALDQNINVYWVEFV